MTKKTITKRFIACFLVLTFLNLTVAQGAMAQRRYNDYYSTIGQQMDKEMDKIDQRVLVGSLVILAGLLVYWALKSRPASDNQKQKDTGDQEQGDAMSPVSDKTAIQSADLAIVK